MDTLKSEEINGQHSYKNLIHLLSDPEFLMLHYEAKGRNYGYMTPAVDKETVDAIDSS